MTAIAANLDEERLSFDVTVHHPKFERMKEKQRLQFVFLVLEWMLGGGDVERWVGSVDAATERSPSAHGRRFRRPGRRCHGLSLDQTCVLLEGPHPDGLPMAALARRRLRWIDSPLLDQHNKVTFTYIAGQSGEDMDPALLGAIVGAVVAGVLTPVGAWFVNRLQANREREDRHAAAHLNAAAEIVSSLQNLNRELINVARANLDNKADADNAFWRDLHAAATRWNTGRYVAALYCSQQEINLINDLDKETDKLLGLAMSKVWNPRDFRQHRQALGSLAASFLRQARSAAGQEPVALPSLWAWDESPPPAFVPVPMAEGRP